MVTAKGTWLAVPPLHSLTFSAACTSCAHLGCLPHQPCPLPAFLPLTEVAWASPDYQWHLPDVDAAEMPPAGAGAAPSAAGAAPSRRRLAQSGFPNDPEYRLQWHLPSINAPGAWAQGASGAGVRVAKSARRRPPPPSCCLPYRRLCLPTSLPAMQQGGPPRGLPPPAAGQGVRHRHRPQHRPSRRSDA